MTALAFPHPTENSNGFPANARVFNLTPADARRMLTYNRKNRPVSRPYIAKLINDMKSARYTFNGETIKFAINGELLDGQHRLIALSEMPEGTVIPFLVVFGLEPSTQDTMDQGRTRGVKDQLFIDGLSNDKSGSIAAAVRVKLIWSQNMLFHDTLARNITNPEVIAWAHSHPVELSLFNEVSDMPGVRKVKARTGVVIAVLAHFWEIDSEDAELFTTLLTTGAGMEVDNPVFQLRDRLDRIRTTKVKVSDRELIALFIIAWNHWRKGHTLQKLQLPKGGLTEDNFPVAR